MITTNSTEPELSKPISIITPLTTLPIEANTLVIINTNNTASFTNSTPIFRPDIFSFHLDLKTGKIESFDVNEQRLVDSFCLSKLDMDGIKSILTTSQICQPQRDSQNNFDPLCNQSYIMPYAKLQFDNLEISLGEKVNGCDIPTDLCGELSKQFQENLKNIILNMKFKKCNL